MTIQDEHVDRAGRARFRSVPTPKSSREVRLVGEVLRAEDRLMQPQEDAATQAIDPDVVRRRRERRSQRAFAGWLASRMRARAHERDVAR
jgi:hypothetical protein